MSEDKYKLLYKVLGILLLAAGIFFIVVSLVDFFAVIEYNTNLGPNETVKNTNNLWSIIAAPLMFGGFFLFVLGFGKKKTDE